MTGTIGDGSSDGASSPTLDKESLPKSVSKLIEARMLEDQTQQTLSIIPADPTAISSPFPSPSPSPSPPNKNPFTYSTTSPRTETGASSPVPGPSPDPSPVPVVNSDTMLSDIVDNNMNSPLKRRLENSSKAVSDEIDGSLSSLETWKAEREAKLRQFTEDYEVQHTPRKGGDNDNDNDNDVEKYERESNLIDMKIKQIHVKNEDNRLKVLSEAKDGGSKLQKLLADRELDGVERVESDKVSQNDFNEAELQLEKLEMDLKISEIQHTNLEDLNLGEEEMNLLRINQEKMRLLESEMMDLGVGIGMGMGMGVGGDDVGGEIGGGGGIGGGSELDLLLARIDMSESGMM